MERKVKIFIGMILAGIFLYAVTARVIYVPGDHDYSCLYNIYNASNISICAGGELDMNGGDIVDVGSFNMTGDIDMNCLGSIYNVTNITFCPNCSDKSSGWLSNTDTIMGCSDNVRIGNAGVDSHILTADDDLFISGKFEVDGFSYFDEIVYFDEMLYFTVSSNIYAKMVGEPDDGMHFGLEDFDGTANYNFIFTNIDNINKDHDHSTPSSDPTLFMHSATDPDTDNTQWGSLSHIVTDFRVGSGNGSIVLDPMDDGEVFMNETNLTIGNRTGNVVLDMYDNGTYLIMDTLNPVWFTNNITVDTIIFKQNESLYITANATCVIIRGGSSTLNVC